MLKFHKGKITSSNESNMARAVGGAKILSFAGNINDERILE